MTSCSRIALPERLPQVILRQLAEHPGLSDVLRPTTRERFDGCAAKRTHQEVVKIWLISSVAQRSRSVSFSGWPASVALVGRGTSTEPAASLTTLRG